ncbi:MAG: carboxyl-terminal processing protease [Cocleimonas sp.]|jgi:carboxyl-terminal processing protease
MSMINRMKNTTLPLFWSYPLKTTLRMTLLSSFIVLAGCLGTPPSATLIESANAAENANTPIGQLTPRHSFEYKIINSMLKRYHYKKFELNDEFSGKILDQYLDQLDPSKVYFTEADIKSFNVHRDKFDDYINDGNTEVAVNIFKKYQQRINERSRYATMRIEKPFALNTDAEYLLDRKDAKWEISETALNLLWEKRIKNAYISEILADTKPAEAVKKLKKRYVNMTKRTSQIKPNELFQTIVNAYAGAVEPHTSYLSPRSSEQFDINMSLSLSGIGAVLRTDEDHTKIVSVVPGGPADLTGQISAGDRIIGVGQKTATSVKDIVGWRLSDVVNIIRGEKGSTVVLSVLPNATGLSGKPKTVNIVRDKIKLEHQAASKRIIEIDRPKGKVKVGVIDLPSFYIDFKARNRGDKDYAGTTRDVKKLLLELNKEGIDDLIIDLRGNGGGSLSEVVSLTGLFIDKGPVVQINDTTGRTDILKDEDSGVLYDGPMAVLIDSGSASASEIFAGAIQDYQRGVIIGETTFGKGTVQTVLPLESYTRKTFDKPLGQIKITSAQFFRINGESTQHKGVIPDLPWNLPKIEGDFGERAYKNALPWRRIGVAKHKDFDKAFNSTVMQQAKEKSQARIANNPKFKTTVERVKLLVTAGNEKTASLNLEKRKAKRALFDKQLLSLENKLQVANGLPEYKTMKELRDAQEKKNDDIFTKKPVDVFLNEAAHILTDLNDFNIISASKQ